MKYINHSKCRACGTKLEPYLDLGLMPLSNGLLESPEEVAVRFPLNVALCTMCGLSQLTVVIPPEVMFNNYVYRSGISQGYKLHCSRMAVELARKYNLGRSTFHIDIAGNDGTLLKVFHELYGHSVLNVDPATNMEELSSENGAPMWNNFWSSIVAHSISTTWGKADLITATNVLAHVDNVVDFLNGIAIALAPNGVAVIEFPYLLDFIEKREFDTIYFEHVSYFSIAPLRWLCEKAGLILLDVTRHDIHGGSVRCEIGKYGKSHPRVLEIVNMEIEARTTDIFTYRMWATRVFQIKTQFKALVRNLREQGDIIWGFAASAKGNTLLNACGITKYDIAAIVDETPEKIGKWSPGTGIPIVELPKLIEAQPDYLVLLAWNFADEIIDKCRAHGYKGKFIYPLTLEIK